MPQPDTKALTIAGPLANVSIRYKNQMYVGDQLFAIIDTDDPKTKVTRYVKGAWFRDEAGVRAPGTQAKRGGFVVDSVAISTAEYAFAKEVTEEDRRFAKSTFGPVLQPDQDAIEYCADRIDLSKERRVAAVLKAANFSGAGAGGEDVAGLWAPNDGTNTFVEDVETRIETIRAATGMRPNKLMLSANTYAKLKQITALQNRIAYVERAIITPNVIAALFGLDEVIVGGAIYSSAVEKKDGTDYTAVNIWENNATKGCAFLYYKHPTIGLKVPMVGCQVRLRYENGLARRTSMWNEPAEHQDVYEVAEETAFVVTGTDLGFWWNDTIVT
jgi:hypothetical protein